MVPEAGGKEPDRFGGRQAHGANLEQAGRGAVKIGAVVGVVGGEGGRPFRRHGQGQVAEAVTSRGVDRRAVGADDPEGVETVARQKRIQLLRGPARIGGGMRGEGGQFRPRGGVVGEAPEGGGAEVEPVAQQAGVVAAGAGDGLGELTLLEGAQREEAKDKQEQKQPQQEGEAQFYAHAKDGDTGGDDARERQTCQPQRRGGRKCALDSAGGL